jgi:hypothetical protein
MAVPDKAKPTTAVRVEKGDTLSAIAKDAGITLKQLYDLNPKFKEDPKYKGGNMIFSNTLVNLAPPVKVVTTPKVETPVVLRKNHLKKNHLKKNHLRKNLQKRNHLRMTRLLKTIHLLSQTQAVPIQTLVQAQVLVK